MTNCACDVVDELVADQRLRHPVRSVYHVRKLAGPGCDRLFCVNVVEFMLCL